ncbi:tryptophan synthase subunit(beta) [Streptomyces sp. Act143]|uniref:tryptophan biosynthesis modulator TrpM n=1 Tax=Streptomyces sp. Act143 TaxID=2200760 RepID=UPI000D67FB47|nr:tryptophan synthase subunit(beta) [Streptomyces sp. Act143]
MTLSLTLTTVDRYARLARGCRPRGCRAPARRVHGRRVRYVIGDEPGQVNGMRWQRTSRGAGLCSMRGYRRVGATSHIRSAAD